MPASASCSPIHDEFVSTIWPSSSSVPMATTSQRMAGRLRAPARRLARSAAGIAGSRPVRPGRGPCWSPRSRPSSRYCTPVTRVSTTATHRHRVGQRSGCSTVSGRSAKPTASSCTTVFTFARLRGRDGQALAAQSGAEQADRHLADRDERDRQPPEPVRGHEREHRARARAPCRPAGRGTHPSGSCRSGGPGGRRRRR